MSGAASAMQTLESYPTLLAEKTFVGQRSRVGLYPGNIPFVIYLQFFSYIGIAFMLHSC